MSNIILPNKSIIRPNSRPVIDWTHPFNNGLVASWEFGYGQNPFEIAYGRNIDLVQNINPVVLPSHIGNTVSLTGTTTSNSGYRVPYYREINESNSRTELTFYAVAELTRVDNNGEHVVARLGRGFALQWFGNATPSLRRWRFLLETSTHSGWSTANDLIDERIEANVPWLIGFTWKAGQFYRWFTGPIGRDIRITARATGTVPGGVFNPGYPGTSRLWLGGSESATQNGYVRPYTVRLIGRAISDAEIFALGNNPWQVFDLKKQITYFDFGAGGPSTYNDYVNILYQQNCAASSNTNSNSQLSLPVNSEVSSSVSANLTEGSTFTLINDTTSDSSLESYLVSNIDLLSNFNHQANANVETAQEAIVNNILNVASTNTSNMSAAFNIESILNLTNTAVSNISSNAALAQTYNLSSLSIVDIIGNVNVDLTIGSNYGILSTTTLASKNNIELSASIATSSLNNIVAFSELAVSLSNSLNSAIGSSVDVATLLAFNNSTSSALSLKVGGSITLNSNSSVLSNTLLSSNDSIIFSTLLAKEVLSNIIANSSVDLDYEIDIISSGVNPLLKIRVNSKEILIAVESKDFLLLDNYVNILINK